MLMHMSLRLIIVNYLVYPFATIYLFIAKKKSLEFLFLVQDSKISVFSLSFWIIFCLTFD